MVMVMETPSPQCVGREFVRQYYTMLNEAPLHLHRFYNTNSSFVHGGIEQPGQETEPVYGQQEIHKKIMQLNFRDCHAKIRQVDSHATMGDGVVVQVTGELSNNGQPMRRFMQTFVLALQSPKRYYVHNDIFRYQDEVFQDEDDAEVVEGTAESEAEEDHTEVTDATESVSDTTAYFDQQTVSNGNAHIEEIAAMTAAAVQPVTAPTTHVQSSSPPPIADQSEAEIDKLESTSDNELMFEEKVQSKSPEPSDEHLQCPQPPDSPNEPKTYANMVSKNASSASSGSSGSGSQTSWQTAGTSKIPSTPPISNPLPMSSVRMDSSKPDGFMSSQSGGLPQRMQQQRTRSNSIRGSGMSNYMTNTNRDRGPMRNSDDGGDGDRRRITTQYPDSHQLFVGNLPMNITEDELKEQFSKYGNVVDLRINNRANTKPGTNVRTTPNFGFIMFEDSGAVQRALAALPIMYNEKHRLNIEAKRAKPREQRIGGGDGRANSGRGGMNRMGMGINRGGNRSGPGGLNRSDNRGGGPNMGNRGFGPGPRR